jgi:hypothetical protein
MYSGYDNLFASIRSPSPLTNFFVEWEQNASLYKLEIIVFIVAPCILKIQSPSTFLH